jgi:hypothetical protein
VTNLDALEMREWYIHVHEVSVYLCRHGSPTNILPPHNGIQRTVGSAKYRPETRTTHYTAPPKYDNYEGEP